MNASVCPDCGTELHTVDGPFFCPACTLGGLFDPLPEAPVAEMSGRLVDGRFRLVEKIGEGGFAEVWRAEQLRPVQRVVALKWLKHSVASPQVLARFEGERTALARMQHPGVATVLDAGCEDGRPWFAAELLDGRPLTAACDAAGLDGAARCQLMAAVCAAVQHAHSKGVIHRDLKPSNILTTRSGPDGATLTARVIDFGVARALEDPLHDAAATALRQLVGTPGYMSPEQAAPGSADVDVRSDVHALGVVLYEMLAGRLPWPPRARRAPDDAPPVWPGDSPAARLPRAWQHDLLAVCAKAAAFDPAQRYATASALAEDVERVLRHEPVSARAPGGWYALTKFGRRHRVAVTLGAAALAAVLAGLAVSTALYLRADRAAQQLRESLARQDWLAAQQRKELRDYHGAVPLLARALESQPLPGAAADLLALTAGARTVDLVSRSAPLPAAWGQPLAARLRGGTAAALFPDTEGGSAVLARWQPLADGGISEITLPAGTWSRLELTPNGRWAAVWGTAQELCLVNLKTGVAETRTWPRGGAATVVHVHPEGRNVMAGTAQGILWQLDGRNSREEAVFDGALTVLDAVRSERGLLFVAATDLGAVHRWSPPLRGASLPSPLFTMPAGVTALIAPDGARTVIAGDAAGNVQWVSESRAPALIPAGARPAGAITQISATPGARQVFAASRRGLLRGWDTESREPAGAAVELAERVLALDGAAGGTAVLAAGEAGALRLWDPAAGTLTALPSLPGAMALDAATREGRGGWHLLHWLPEARTLCLLDTATRTALPLPLEPHGGTHLAWTADDTVAGRDEAHAAVRWTLPSLTKSPLHPPGDGAPVLAWLPGGPVGAVVLHATGALHFPDNSQTLHIPPPADSAWEHGSLAAEAPVLVTAAPQSAEALLHSWDGESVRETARLAHSSAISALALDAAGETCVCGLVSGGVVIHRSGTALPQAQLHPGKVTAAACARRGLAATGSEDGGVILWNTLTGRPHAEPIRLHEPVTHLAWDAAGQRLCAGTETSLSLIDATTGTIIGVPLGVGLPLRALALNPSGTAAAFSMSARGGHQTETYLWLLPPPDAAVPVWFREYAVRWSGTRLEEGQLRPQPVAPRQSLAALVPADDHSPAARLARWLTGATAPEQVHPWLTLPPETMEALRSRWPQTRSVELLREEMERAAEAR